MGEIVIKVPGNIREIMEISDPSVVSEILALKRKPREGWRELFDAEDELLVDDVFQDEDMDWWDLSGAWVR